MAMARIMKKVDKATATQVINITKRRISIVNGLLALSKPGKKKNFFF